MKWYYAQGGVQQGPVEDTEFENLVSEGVVTNATLVWHEGMPNWQPYESLLVPAGAEQPQPTLIPQAMEAAQPAPRKAGPMRIQLAGTKCGHCGRSFPAEELVHLHGVAVCSECKPWALQSLQEGLALDDGSEQIRKDHISHEASIKSVGLLYFIGAAFLVIGGIGLLAAPATPDTPAIGAPMAIFFLMLGGIQFWTGMGLRKLIPWSRIAAIVLSGMGLLAIGPGTIISGYILYLLLSKKGSMIFSDRYKQVIAATPHIKYRTSILIWILLGILLLMLLSAVIAVLMA